MINRNLKFSKLLIQSSRSLPGNLWGLSKRQLSDIDELTAELLYGSGLERDFLDDA